MNVIQFNEAMSKLPEPVTDSLPPFWEYWRWQLWQLGQANNPINFMHWPCIYHTMLVRHWPAAVDFEYRYLMQDAKRWGMVIQMSAAGDDFYGDTIFSQNLIHQAYHLKLWEDTTGKRVDELQSIVEFGGGYGALALVANRLGFNGDYAIYDLPEFALLQQWFLSQCGVKNVRHIDKIKREHPDLLIALYSLSEAPMALRDKFLEKVRAKSDLFLYSGKWETWDNVGYFQQNPTRFGCIHSEHTELSHLPDAQNWYSIYW